MVETENNADNLNLETGWLCLDFANTADWHASDHPEEKLNNYTDLITWAQQVGILAENDAQQLLKAAARRPGEATAIVDQTVKLREAFYRIFSAVADSRLPDETDLDILNDALAGTLGRLQVIHRADGFAWEWVSEEDELDRMLLPLARSAADLLTSEALDRVKECADDRGCGYLFLDTSRNRSRRWCDMRGCGNRAKARRHYKRQRATGTSEP